MERVWEELEISTEEVAIESCKQNLMEDSGQNSEGKNADRSTA